MEIQLREMSLEEFKIFSENSIFDYANDLVKASNITMDEASIQAQGEFEEMFPNGLETKDNVLRIIVDVAEQKAVGIIWYLFEMTDDIK